MIVFVLFYSNIVIGMNMALITI